MITRRLTKYKDGIKSVINQMEGLNKCRRRFIIDIFCLFISIPNRVNFLQLGRFGEYCEQHYRNQFENRFDFMAFNKTLILNKGGGHYTIAFDPTYISKSGKKTPHIGWYWSGCSGRIKWGLELGGIAVIDINNHTGFHLEAIQTPVTSEAFNLMDHYVKVLLDRKENLLDISKYIVADAYFSKYKFVEGLNKEGLEVVCRLRNDADLKYLYQGEQKKGRGRPRKFTTKIDYKSIDEKYFKTIEANENNIIYNAIVYSKSLKRNINLVIVMTNKKGHWSHKLYFCTDLELDPLTILEYYKTRFQIEFIYRDGKQFCGLEDCQARSENKLHFHHNAALTAVNLAKFNYWITIEKEERPPFSMATIKTLHYNELLLKRFFNVFAILPNLRKNKRKLTELIRYGAIAA